MKSSSVSCIKSGGHGFINCTLKPLRKTEYLPLPVWVRSLSSSLCKLLGTALSAGERSMAIWDSVPEISFHQRKELSLVSCTNCLMSSLLKSKIVNAPFAFFSSLNVWHTKPCPPLAIQDIYTLVWSACKATVARLFKQLQLVSGTVRFALVSSMPRYEKLKLAWTSVLSKIVWVI